MTPLHHLRGCGRLETVTWSITPPSPLPVGSYHGAPRRTAIHGGHFSEPSAHPTCYPTYTLPDLLRMGRDVKGGLAQPFFVCFWPREPVPAEARGLEAQARCVPQFKVLLQAEVRPDQRSRAHPVSLLPLVPLEPLVVPVPLAPPATVVPPVPFTPLGNLIPLVPLGHLTECDR